jgi:Flp pilus assembly protein TadG
MRRLNRTDDSGAVAVLIAVLLSGGVLLGMGALVIDVGLLAREQEQLQSGADAASWTVAQNCITLPAQCTSAAQTAAARTVAGRNAEDSAADATVCVAAACTPPCQGTSSGTYVEVRTGTRNADGSTLLPPVLAQALSGTDYDGTRVTACARVSWGPYPRAAATPVFALGLSACTWAAMTGSRGYLRAEAVLDQPGVERVRGLPAPVTGDDQAVPPNNTLVNGTACPATQGWTWLGAPDATLCQITVKPGDVVAGTAGGLGPACAAKLRSAYDRRSALLVPIFDSVTGGLGPRYRIAGFAAFAVTGFGTLGGLLTLTTSWLGTNTGACLLCISGYFTRTIRPVSQPDLITPSADYGTYVIGRTG